MLDQFAQKGSGVEVLATLVPSDCKKRKGDPAMLDRTAAKEVAMNINNCIWSVRGKTLFNELQEERG
jgi:hypothetical protein